MSAYGARTFVAAPVVSHENGSAITYGTGFVVGPLVAVSLNNEINDNPDFGDNVEQDNDNGMNGYSGTVEVTDIVDENKAKLLGWKTVGEGANAEYEAADTAAPKMGWGFIKDIVANGVRRLEGRWYHLAQFTQPSESATTKRRQIEWQHDPLSVNGLGAVIDNSGETKWFRHKTFTSYAAAEAWLFAKANISTSTTPATTT